MTLRELADIELSTHHFVRMFKRSLGLRPYQYLLQRRVERATELFRKKITELSTPGSDIGDDDKKRVFLAGRPICDGRHADR